MGVVVGQEEGEAVVSVRVSLGGGTEAGGAVEGVACWGGDAGWCHGGAEGRAAELEVGAWIWWVGEHEEGEVEDEVEEFWEHVGFDLWRDGLAVVAVILSGACI